MNRNDTVNDYSTFILGKLIICTYCGTGSADLPARYPDRYIMCSFDGRFHGLHHFHLVYTESC